MFAQTTVYHWVHTLHSISAGHQMSKPVPIAQLHSFHLFFAMPDTRKGSKQLDTLMPDNDQLRLIIRDEFDKMRKELRSEMTQAIKEAVTTEFTKLNDKISEQNKRIEFLENAPQEYEYSRLLDKRRENACNIVLSGLPESEEENIERKTTDIL